MTNTADSSSLPSSLNRGFWNTTSSEKCSKWYHSPRPLKQSLKCNNVKIMFCKKLGHGWDTHLYASTGSDLVNTNSFLLSTGTDWDHVNVCWGGETLFLENMVNIRWEMRKMYTIVGIIMPEYMTLLEINILSVDNHFLTLVIWLLNMSDEML